MSITREIYRVTVHARNRLGSEHQLAATIIGRWMPNNGGGAPMLLTPSLVRLLAPICAKARAQVRDLLIEVDTRAPQVVITEIS